MSTPKYIIELTPGELQDLMSAIVDAKAANMETLTNHVAAGQISGLEGFIDRDTSYQHIFNLVLYAKKEEGGEDG